MEDIERRFIENPKFPIREINEKSEKEKGPARPPYWEMVFYWTRKPLIGVRSVIAGALLPYDIGVERFKKLVCLDENTPHRFNPRIPNDLKKYFEGKKLLDPFAGFGSIPLEGLRLGLEVTAVELLPTTYIFLKAVLEYPKKFGKSLIKDVEKWGNWITEQLKNDPEIKELYDEDVAVYIGTWEIKCPHCGKWTPLIGNYWLARVKDNKKGYKRLAFMKAVKKEDKVDIEVVDVNKIAKENNLSLNEAKVDKNKIKIGDLELVVPNANIEPKRNQAICLYCGNIIKFADKVGNHYIEKPKNKDVDFYVKFALRKYHEGDESFARQRLLVKVKIKDRDLEFEPATEEDNIKLEKAKEKVRKLIEKGDPDVPSEPISYYSVRYLFPILYGMTEWYKLFNPRQLLTLVKIVKLIREVGKRVEEEKLKEGWDKEKAFEYAEAIATYLSVALINYVDFNSMQTYWEVVWLTNKRTIAVRGISMMWNWCDVVPTSALAVGSFVKSIQKELRGIDYLTSALAPSSQKTLTDFTKTNTIKVLQGDATSLNLGEKFDLIVTDPPYADDVPYTELSDFYYVWLKRALSDVEDNKLVPRFHKEAFFKMIGKKYKEIKTQWQEFAKREVSKNSGRFMNENNKNKVAEKHFENLFSQAFISMKNHLKDDGLLITYYAHTNPESWATLLEAGWKRAKLTITRAIPLSTESKQSIVSRGKLSLDTSIIAVWKKKTLKDKILISNLIPKLREKGKETAELLIKHGQHDLDLLYGVMAGILEEVTQYNEIVSPEGKLTTKDILERYIYPLTIYSIIDAISKEKEGTLKILSKPGLFYTTYKILFGNKTLGSGDLILLNISTGIDARNAVEYKLIKRDDKGFVLNSPDLIKELDEKYLYQFLIEKNINPTNPEIKTSIDILHLLEYYAFAYPISTFKSNLEELRNKYPTETEEAINIAKLINKYYTSVFAKLYSGKKDSEIDKQLKKDKIYELYLIRRLVRFLEGKAF
ncbi:hypothetical protein J422_04655 [Methanocaldococcus villosus KIN24-T80]|uniref:DUF1156 domain-containing protein n=1 Tax=Methanocaldococcus villosus KIN24-T80 TaxID=1069083 RepID=N6VXY9_9EURY|nr:DUF1156 domain-containing protein [Methanocaldococcus villosus]ENN96002.1 hypothetical protein J422_04655 [Methanocaldococcus villosus KIN24-T80]